MDYDYDDADGFGDEEEYITGYDVEEDDFQGDDVDYGETDYTDFQGDDVDYGETDYTDFQGDDDDFGQFAYVEQPQLVTGYSQMEQLGYGDVQLGTTVAGNAGKLEKILKFQSVPREKLYTQALKKELQDSYKYSFDVTEHYIDQVLQIPRYWVLNIPALTSAIIVISDIQGAMDSAKLEKYSKATGTNKVDLYRYYRLVSKYVKKHY